jgi:hypothetical protein
MSWARSFVFQKSGMLKARTGDGLRDNRPGVNVLWKTTLDDDPFAV